MTATLVPPTRGDQLPRAERPIKVRPERRLKQRLVLAAILVVSALVTWVVFDRLVGPMIATQRQQHLAASFNTPQPRLRPGDAMGVLQIPRLGASLIVVEGVSVDGLRGGPSHRSDSALPGDAGVMAIYGHRAAYGKPFADIDQLAAGDQIVVQARTGPIVQYVVDRVERDTDAASVVIADAQVLSYLLLVTSEPGRTNNQQVVVVARALPLGDVPAIVPDLATSPQAEAPYGIDGLLTIGALAAAVCSAGYLRRRTGLGVTIAVVAPMAVYGWIRVLMLVDAVLPLTR
jgi:sortase A